MALQFLSNLPPVGESVAKLASEGGLLISDKFGVYGFFALCLVFVGACLLVPPMIHEKYYKTGDDELPVAIDANQPNTSDSAA